MERETQKKLLFEWNFIKQGAHVLQISKCKPPFQTLFKPWWQTADEKEQQFFEQHLQQRPTLLFEL